jgi:uncharacterized membrane-anchored protein YhcB (DUF1043 family)
MKKTTAWLIIILALIIGVTIGLNVQNPREDGIIPSQNIQTPENGS